MEEFLKCEGGITLKEFLETIDDHYADKISGLLNEIPSAVLSSSLDWAYSQRGLHYWCALNEKWLLNVDRCEIKK